MAAPWVRARKAEHLPAGLIQFYRRSLEIAERLWKEEPGRADLQTGLVVPLFKIAQVAPKSAAVHFTRALEILRTLQAEGRLSPDKAGWIAIIEGAMRGGEG